jgi:hypothetical protein
MKVVLTNGLPQCSSPPSEANNCSTSEEIFRLLRNPYVKKFYVVPTLRLCVLYGSQNKQQLLPYKTLRDWFL